MNHNSVGIVLRYLSKSKNKIAVLDKQYGRMEYNVNSFDKSVGSLLSYTISTNGKNFLHDIHLLYTPLSLGRSDVLFLHHIFELIYYFAPVGSCVRGVFDLLAFLYTIETMFISIQFKKFFLFKLLTLLGATPSIEAFYSSSINRFSIMRLEEFDESVCDSENEKKLDKWLWYSIIQHPYSNEFKTVHFLEQNRAI